MNRPGMRAIAAWVAAAAMLAGFHGCAGEKEVMKKQLTTCKQRLDEYVAQNESLKEQLAQTQSEAAGLKTRLAEAEKEHMARLDKQSKTIAELEKRQDPLAGLAGELDRAGFSCERHGAALVVNLAAGGELFDSGQVTLGEAARKRLEPVAVLLGRSGKGLEVAVVGHSDATPVVRNKERYPTNYELSFARARSVQQFLIDRGGLDAKNVFPASKAEFDPVAPNKTAVGRAQNRRVTLMLVPSE
jgi:chemotaxis protein MotB